MQIVPPPKRRDGIQKQHPNPRSDPIPGQYHQRAPRTLFYAKRHSLRLDKTYHKTADVPWTTAYSYSKADVAETPILREARIIKPTHYVSRRLTANQGHRYNERPQMAQAPQPAGTCCQQQGNVTVTSRPRHGVTSRQTTARPCISCSRRVVSRM